jgi:hypothetical protein
MHDGIKSHQNKWVILGQELTENNLRKFGHNARSAKSRLSFAGSSFTGRPQGKKAMVSKWKNVLVQAIRWLCVNS